MISALNQAKVAVLNLKCVVFQLTSRNIDASPIMLGHMPISFL